MLKNKFGTIVSKIKSVTLNFIFITLFISAFQAVFGQENSIVGICLVIIMFSAMLRDLTATPIKQLLIQIFILESMAVASFLVTSLPAPAAAAVNFVILFVLLYAFTFEYATHLYMPYILSYLFILFISPASAQQMPKRFLAMLIGAVCIIAYQLVMGRNRFREVPKQALAELVEEARSCVSCLISGEGKPDNPQMVHSNLCKLSRLIFERRKRTLCISDASGAMLDCGRELERIILMLYKFEGTTTGGRGVVLRQTLEVLDACSSFVDGKASAEILPSVEDFSWSADEHGAELCECLAAVCTHLRHMTDPKTRNVHRKTPLSTWVRFKAAMNVSQVRMVYAVRIAILLTVATIFVQQWNLPHGKWLMFTLASVSLPCADGVLGKAAKRLFATLLGGAIFVAAFAIIPNAAGRTVVMMLAGYMTSYFLDYKFTFACSTIGALGGAAMMAFGVQDVGEMFLVRIGYIVLGIAIAYVANCVLFPFKHRAATQKLWEKHDATAEALSEVCRAEEPDHQLYFSLLIQAYLQEEKLCENIDFANEPRLDAMLQGCMEKIRGARLTLAQEATVAV